MKLDSNNLQTLCVKVFNSEVEEELEEWIMTQEATVIWHQCASYLKNSD
jgi:hypothetical protein